MTDSNSHNNFELDKTFGHLEESDAGKRNVLTIKNVNFAFHWCPPGTFMMGSQKSENNRRSDEIQHRVTLTRGFWMLETPVTVGMFRSFMNATSYTMGDGYIGKGGWGYNVRTGKLEQDPKYTWENPGFSQKDDHPVTEVDWAGAKAFCRWLSDESGEKIALPSEAQWEYACRAGTTTPFNFGSVLNGDKANCNGNYPYGTSEKGQYLEKTTAVKSYEPNAWGLYDMHGNVCEWCEDWYDDYSSGNVTDPTGPAGGFCRVNRGGGWCANAGNCRSAHRDWSDPSSRYFSLGFRLALQCSSER